jgi:hypothetical protein
MRLIHAGAKVLAKQDKGEVKFRILDEGLETMLPFLKDEQIIHGNFDDLKPLLREQYPFFNKFSEGCFRSGVEKHGMNVKVAVALFVSNNSLQLLEMCLVVLVIHQLLNRSKLLWFDPSHLLNS